MTNKKRSNDKRICPICNRGAMKAGGKLRAGGVGRLRTVWQCPFCGIGLYRWF